MATPKNQQIILNRVATHSRVEILLVERVAEMVLPLKMVKAVRVAPHKRVETTPARLVDKTVLADKTADKTKPTTVQQTKLTLSVRILDT
jgi:hypothetical protein